jgi:PAS domain S-box-containing protein
MVEDINPLTSDPDTLRTRAWLHRLIQLVAPPLLSDEERQCARRWIQALCIGMLALAVLTLIDGLVPGRYSDARLASAIQLSSGLSIGYYMIVLALLVKGHTRLAAASMIGHLWLTATAFAFIDQGAQSLSMFIYFALVSVAGLLIGRNGPLLIAVPSSVFILIIFLAQRAGIIGMSGTIQAAQYKAFFLIFMLLLTAAVGSQSLSNLNRLLTRAQNELDERLQIEAALRENQIRYKALYERTNDMVFIISLEGIYLASNAKAQEFLGYTDEDLLGQHYIDFIAAEDEEPSRDRYQILLAGELLPVYERKMTHKDGSIRTVEINAAMVLDEEGRPLHFQSVLRDITDRKKTEREITRLATELEALHDISLEIGKQLELDALLDLIVERAATLLGANFGRLLLRLDGSQDFEIAAVHNGQSELIGYRMKAGQGFAGQVASTGQSALQLNYQDWANRYEELSEIQISQIAGTALLDAGEVIGILTVFDEDDSSVYEAIDLRLLELLAGQAVIAIQNAVLVGKVREQTSILEDRVESRTADLAMANRKLAEEIEDRFKAQEHLVSALDRTEALYSLGKLLIGGDGGQTLLNQLAEKLAELMEADKVQISTFAPETRQTNAFATYPAGDSGQLFPSHTASSEGLYGWVIRNGQAAGATRNGHFPDFVPTAYALEADQEPGTAMIAPLFSGTSVAGIIVARRDDEGADFTAEDLEQFNGLANQIAIVLEKSALVERLQITNDQLKRSLNLMAGRELRMRELKSVIRDLSLQLVSLGATPRARDPLDSMRLYLDKSRTNDS